MPNMQNRNCDHNPRGSRMIETTKSRTLFDRFIEENEIYDGQISSSLGHFRNDLMIPILQKIKELEKKANE